MRKSLSIIIPVYKSEKFLKRTIDETVAVLREHNFTFEIILINDGSPDNSWNVIEDIVAKNDQVIGINLLKNYGQHTAVFCGLSRATSDYLVTMDDDLQNPPMEIIKLFNRIEEGYDLVFAKFDTKKHSGFRILGSKIVGGINRKIFDYPKDIILTNFRIFTKDVAKRVIVYNTMYPYIPGLLIMFSSKIGNVLTLHASRENGQSNYTISKIFKLVSRLLINYSSFPLVILSYLGILMALLAFIISIGIIIKAFIYGTSVEGWASLMVLTSFFSGLLVLMLGILGVYVSRILKQISYTSSYQIKKEIGLNSKSSDLK